MQRTVHFAAIAFFLAAVLGACGSRGPLDDDIILINADSGVIDSGVIDSAPVVDSAPPPISDAAIDTGTGLIQCGTCVAEQCGTDVLTCITDPACQTILQCVGTTCFGGAGGFDPSCLIGCAGGGGTGVGEALGIFQCITGSCGNACGGLLGGLGGLGGGIPDPAPPSPKSAAQKHAIFEEAFSAWPELTSSEKNSDRR